MSAENEPPLEKGEIGIVVESNCDFFSVGEEVLVLEGLKTREVRNIYSGELVTEYSYMIQTNKVFFWCGIPNYNSISVARNAIKRKKLPPEQKSKDTDTDTPDALGSWNDPV